MEERFNVLFIIRNYNFSKSGKLNDIHDYNQMNNTIHETLTPLLST
jgi:hypothetical protein